MKYYSRKHEKQIRKIFEKDYKKFVKTFKNNPSTCQYLYILKSNFFKSITNFSYRLIFLNLDKYNKNDFLLNYNVLLKAMILLTLSIYENNKINIFKYELSVEQNPYTFHNHFSLSDKYKDKLLQSYDFIYLFAKSLYEMIEWTISKDELYDLFLEIISLFIVNIDSYKTKKYFFINFKLTDYTEEKTRYYLELFKSIRTKLQLLFPNIFNELIYVINCQR